MDFGDLIDDEEDSRTLRRNDRPRTRRITLDDDSDSDNGHANADDAPEDSDQQDDDTGSEQPKRKRRKKGSLSEIHRKKYNLPFSILKAARTPVSDETRQKRAEVSLQRKIKKNKVFSRPSPSVRYLQQC
jgi:hypothetical protein